MKEKGIKDAESGWFISPLATPVLGRRRLDNDADTLPAGQRAVEDLKPHLTSPQRQWIEVYAGAEGERRGLLELGKGELRLGLGRRVLGPPVLSDCLELRVEVKARFAVEVLVSQEGAARTREGKPALLPGKDTHMGRGTGIGTLMPI